MECRIKDRQGNILERKGGQDKLLSYLYGSISGQLLLKGLTVPELSKAAGAFLDSGLSLGLISRFIKSADISLWEYEPGFYDSFNAFFTRKIKSGMRPVDMTENAFVSPCDSKLTVYKIDEQSRFIIKNGVYTVASLLKNRALAERYSGGLCMIFRLEVDDYHRYIYIDNGIKSRNVHINGKYHTVNPAALDKVNVYSENTREYTLLRTGNFGDVVQAEIGAMLVGRIKNHHERVRFSKGEEKGMFEFGGSTIVLLTLPGAVEIDGDILQNTAEGFETVVKMGERIGTGKYRKKGDQNGEKKQ